MTMKHMRTVANRQKCKTKVSDFSSCRSRTTASAGGAGTQGQGRSDITIEGSNIQAGHTTRLSAQGDVNLLAAANTTREQNRSQNSSASIGVSVGASASGIGISATAGASAGKGQGTGSSTTHTNTQVSGQRVQIDSGGDTTLQGAVVSAPQVSARVGGHLTIESLQDSSRYQESSKNAGWSVSVPITGGQAGASVSAGKTNINSQYSSVNEQSAIRAGDGGFDITVGGNTRLVGGAITSSERAVQEGKNRMATGGALQLSDLNNSANFDASSVGIGVGVGTELGSSGLGVGSDKGSASSSTRAAISGIAGDTQARTGDAASGLAPIFDKDRVQAEVNAQVTITAEFGRQAGKAVGQLGDRKLQEAADLKNQAAAETDPERRQSLIDQAQALELAWQEGGSSRVALHTLVGALGGGVGGALGAASSQTLIPQLGAAIDALDVPLEVKQALTQVAAIGVGSAVGGTSGAASAQNATAHNYLTPRENLTRNRAEAECRVSPGSEACATAAQLNVLDQWRDQALAKAAQACNGGNTQACQDLSRTLNQWAAQGQAELQQLSQELKPSCAPPKDCANAANWTNKELNTLQQFGNQIWAANASGAVLPTVGPEAALAGGLYGAVRLSAAGFGLGAGFDAAGQLVQNGTIRPEQSLMAGVTGAVAVPLAARGMRWTPVAGAGAAAANTTFNNIYYDESTNVWIAGGLGGAFGTAGPALGSTAQKLVAPWITNAPRIPITGPAYIPSTPPRFTNVPQQLGTTVKETVSNLPSFIPLDNGKPSQGGKP